VTQNLPMNNIILVTGGAGFIGSNFILDSLVADDTVIVNLDKLTYAGNPDNLQQVCSNPRYVFVHGDIGDVALVTQLLRQHRPRAVVHLAAESHVDRSIHGPSEFIQTNIVGTFSLLDAARAYWQTLAGTDRDAFRFLHVSTDEVFGSLGPDDPPFRETTPYAPNSPYAASKAASDHLVRVYHHTYGLPTLITNCSNNYGPYQFPEKLIPLMILNALHGQPLPVYGDGLNVRDWLHVTDHCAAIQRVLKQGHPGESYNIGGNSEKTNIEVVHAVCAMLDELHPESPVTPHMQLISYVADRPGHDRRYAMDSSKLARELDWRPQQSFATGIRMTVRWYLDHPEWVEQVTSGTYRHWIEKNYIQR
jgi:dTDP-glucose 4,6-dehydratase